jgi:toxoflavin biosynthesis protein ToxD
MGTTYSLAGVEINSVSDRRAMGLPESYSPCRFQHIAAEVAEVRLLGAEELLACMRQPGASLQRRYAAGQLLGLIGDPRLAGDVSAMLEVPGARARLGLDPNEVDAVVDRYREVGVLREWIEKECPVYEVDIPTFRMTALPVTNLEYLRFLEDTSYAELPSSWALGRYPTERANHPVYTVSAKAADDYAAWISRRTGRRLRLPREAEWEYAAAGPSGLEFPWGSRWREAVCNTVELGVFGTTPVGMFPEGASPFGVLDLAGNVEEYVADDYLAYPGGEFIRDDLMKGRKAYRVARGGSFSRFADLARCRRRHGFFERSIYAMGFRLVESNH